MPVVTENRPHINASLKAWLPVAVCLCAVVFESTPVFGSNHTNAPLRVVYQAIFGAVSNADWIELHRSIRKLGHFIVYGTIGLVWLRALRVSFPRLSLGIAMLLALMGTACIAGADELHQHFLPNRTGAFSDVVLDTTAALLLMLLACGWICLRSLRGRSQEA